MRIDKRSGQLSINPETVFYPKLRMNEFTSRPNIDSWQISIDNEVYKGFVRNLTDDDGRKINVHVVFANSYLKTVLLSFFLPSEKIERFRESNYPNADMPRYYLHDSILRNTLGAPLYNFHWGFTTLGSGIDGFSAISVNYLGEFTNTDVLS